MDSVYITAPYRGISVDSDKGTLTLVYIWWEWLDPDRHVRIVLSHDLAFIDYRPDPPLSLSNRLGFGADFSRISLRPDTPTMGVFRYITVPDWLVVILFSIPQAAVAFRTYRDSRRRSCCVSCGYNLTGNTSGTCPECGKVISQTSRLA
jgi:hypothetical protein